MKVLFKKYDKRKLVTLPPVLFEGRVITILNESDAEKAVNYLLTFPVLGIDTETRPAFQRGQSYKVALLQVATPDTCFLFRLNHIGLPPALVRLFENGRVCKVGLSLRDDLLSLRRRADFKAENFVELQTYAKALGIEDQSLQKLYANFFGQKISKRQRLSNWEADVLTEAQQRYAATDAWACVRLYEEFARLKSGEPYRIEDDTEVGTVLNAV